MAMSKQAKSLVSTLLVAVVGGLVVWGGYFATKASDEAEQKQVEAKAKAFDFDKSKAKKVVLTAKDETITFEKSEEGWNVTNPVQARADKAAVDAIVDKLADLKARDLNATAKPKKEPAFVLAPAAKAAEFGLDKPSFVAKIVLDDGKELELKVGDENPYDQSRPYLASGDENIYLADSGVKYPLDKSLFDLRDKSLVTHENSEVQAVEVVSPKGNWSAERGSDGWQLTAPVADKADKAAVDGVLSVIRTARAKAFAVETAPADAEGLKKYGLDTPKGSIVFALGVDKARKTLQFGEVDENGTKKAYARLVEGGPVFEVEPTLVENVGKELKDLRDRTIAAFDKEQVTRLDVTTPDGSFQVTRTKEKSEQGFDQEKFALVGQESEQVKTWKVSSALYTLSTLKGAEIVADDVSELAQYGLDAPRKTFAVLGTEGKELAKILIGNETGTRYYAMKAGGARVFEVEKTTVDDLPQKTQDVLETPPAAVEAPVEGSTQAGDQAAKPE